MTRSEQGGGVGVHATEGADAPRLSNGDLLRGGRLLLVEPGVYGGVHFAPELAPAAPANAPREAWRKVLLDDPRIVAGGELDVTPTPADRARIAAAGLPSTMTRLDCRMVTRDPQVAQAMATALGWEAPVAALDAVLGRGKTPATEITYAIDPVRDPAGGRRWTAGAAGCIDTDAGAVSMMVLRWDIDAALQAGTRDAVRGWLTALLRTTPEMAVERLQRMEVRHPGMLGELLIDSPENPTLLEVLAGRSVSRLRSVKDTASSTARALEPRVARNRLG